MSVSLRELEEVVKRLQPEDNCLRKTVRSSDLKIVLSLIGKCGKVDINEKEIARIIQKYIWDWHEGCELKKDIAYKECPEECCYLFAAKKIKEALATSTFSGGGKVITCECGEWNRGNKNCINCGKPIPVEKKECEQDKELTQRKEIAKLLFKRKDMIPNNSMWLAAEIQDLFIPKPIPADKKECEHEWITSYTYPDTCGKCGYVKPEPKPKDRIKELDRNNYIALGIGLVIDRLNELIRHINKES